MRRDNNNNPDVVKNLPVSSWRRGFAAGAFFLMGSLLIFLGILASDGHQRQTTDTFWKLHIDDYHYVEYDFANPSASADFLNPPQEHWGNNTYRDCRCDLHEELVAEEPGTRSATGKCECWYRKS